GRARGTVCAGAGQAAVLGQAGTTRRLTSTSSLARLYSAAMAKSGGPVSEFLRAAEKVETEMSRLEALSRAACRAKLNTEKNITRAARDLQEAMAQQERLARELRVFGEGMTQMQLRQQSAMNALGEQALELQQRVASLSEHMQRFQALGVKANEVARALRDLAPGAPSEANGSSSEAHAVTPLDIDARFRALLDETKGLVESARAADFPEVASESDALKQRLLAVGSRLAELLKAEGAARS
ncbi:MAG: hypothetical protein ABI895_32490, partial [Deltaproteobacteria bacterium]